ncbi:MAG TPA: transcription antitermination factor NusB [Candidatus Acetothermia bacterium]|nr:transcription antitermination factor NusB [Candidatus Acetothermia bacterium]
MNRHEARAFVLRALYQREFVDTPLAEMLAEVDPGDERGYIEELFNGIMTERASIDALLGEHTVGWRFDRLALIDRNILRIGAYELLHSDDVPPEVAIDEAVELAKEYGTENAPVFINGILDRIWKEHKAS